MTASTLDRTAPQPASEPRREGRQRLAPADRKARIVEEAITIFAEQGFGASTRDLARALGVTQPLLYRYFPTKEALIDSVYEDVVFRPWKPEWEGWLRDRAVPLAERLRRYFKDYARYVTRRNLVRLHIFAGLAGAEVSARFITDLKESHFSVIATELRHEAGLPPAASAAEVADDIEIVWATHSSVFYLGIRKWVYRVEIPQDIDRTIDLIIETFLRGAPTAMTMARRGGNAGRVEC